MTSKTPIHTVREYHNPFRRNEELWGVYVARKILMTVCRSLEVAERECAILNKDPNHYDKKAWAQFQEGRK